MRRHAWHFISATQGLQPVASDGTRRGGARSGGGGSGARGGRRRWVGWRKAIGPRGWWAGTVETMEKLDGPSEEIGTKTIRATETIFPIFQTTI
jgi:hypothetical protein